MKFGERVGAYQIDRTLQVGIADKELRTSVWNVLDAHIWSSQGFKHSQYGGRGDVIPFAKLFWDNCFKKAVDEIPYAPDSILQEIREHLFGCEWYIFFECTEFIVSIVRAPKLAEDLNRILERELSGYRLIKGQFTQITDPAEIEAIQSAISDARFVGAQEHLRTALNNLSRKTNPDYRNSVKESISAVESIACELSGNPKAKFSDALESIERSGKLHGSLKAAFTALFGYASDEDGIRHKILEVPDITIADAKLQLVLCSAFVNYLKSKA